MAAVRLPEVNPELLTRRLFEHYCIEVPVFRWNERLLLRVSFQAYNNETDADALLEALGEVLPTTVGA